MRQPKYNSLCELCHARVGSEHCHKIIQLFKKKQTLEIVFNSLTSSSNKLQRQEEEVHIFLLVCFS